LDNLEKIYEEVANERGLTRTQVRVIAQTQFAFINKTIRTGNFDDVRLKFLGIFKVKPGRLIHLGEKSKQRIKDKTDEFNHLL